jgi:chromosome segregation ATPase
MTLLTLALGLLTILLALFTIFAFLDCELGCAAITGIMALTLFNATVTVHDYDNMEAALAAKDASYAQLETSAAKMGNLLSVKNTELDDAHSRIKAYEGYISSMRTKLSLSDNNLKECQAKQQESTGSIDEIREILEN